MNYTAKLANLTFLINFTKGNKEKIRRYVEMYITSTPTVIEEMKISFKEGNYENVRLKAHSIKPQIQYMGIEELGSVLMRIENIIIQNEGIEQLSELLQIAERINKQASVELSGLINQF